MYVCMCVCMYVCVSPLCAWHVRSDLDRSVATTLSLSITAYSCAGPSPPNITTVTLPPVAPSAPVDVTVAVNATALTVTWGCPVDAVCASVSYRVQLQALPIAAVGDPNAQWTPVGGDVSVAAGAPLSCVFSSQLSTAMEYRCVVTACNDAGPGGSTTSAVAVPGTARPGSVTRVAAVSYRAQQVVLTWTPVPDDVGDGGSPILSYSAKGYFAGNGTEVRVCRGKGMCVTTTRPRWSQRGEGGCDWHGVAMQWWCLQHTRRRHSRAVGAGSLCN